MVFDLIFIFVEVLLFGIVVYFLAGMKMEVSNHKILASAA